MWPKVNASFFSYRNEPDHPTLQLGAGDRRSTNQIKFLAVTLDKNWNFKPHINTVLNKISKSVGVMYWLIQYLPTQTLLSLFHSLAYPYLSYGVESWCGVSNIMSKKVRILQKNIYSNYFQVSVQWFNPCLLQRI